MPSRIRSLLSGMVFGSALTLAGVASPLVIKNQFRLTDFHMLVTFLTASASSAAAIAIYNSLKDKTLPTKPESTLSLCRYDGNIIGGAAIGVGMSLTGACPGTVLVQAVAGSGSSRTLLISTLLAGIGFVCWKRSAIGPEITSRKSETVMNASGWSLRSVVTVYEVAMIGAVLAALKFANRSQTLIHPVAGGLLIGAGQLCSILLTEKPVGVSTAYEDFGKLVCDGIGGKSVQNLSESIVFAAGLVAGSAATMIQIPATQDSLLDSAPTSLLSTLAGGFVMTVGARTAGGCTSGHGISGMAGMSLSSFITVASMFGAGILTTVITELN